jgi:hypothetical protein
LPRQRDPRWLTPAAIAFALLIHLVGLFIVRFEIRYPAVPPEALRVHFIPLGPSATEVVPLAPPQTTAPEVAISEPIAPTTQPRLTAPAARVTGEVTLPETVVTQPPAGETGGTADPRSLVDRVRPRGTDARLWAAMPSEPIVTEQPVDATAAALAPLYAQLNAFNDSSAAAAAAAARATDWTVDDGSGGKWGVSPGRIHLGKLTLPLPFNFSPPPGRRAELSGRLSGWNAIRRQGDQADVNDSFEDRVKAIRERNAAARRDTSRTKLDN